MVDESAEWYGWSAQLVEMEEVKGAGLAGGSLLIRDCEGVGTGRRDQAGLGKAINDRRRGSKRPQITKSMLESCTFKRSFNWPITLKKE